jgi:Phosphotransferase enzyme family
MNAPHTSPSCPGGGGTVGGYPRHKPDLLSDASATPQRNCAYVQTAWQRVEAMRASQGEVLAEPSLSELAAITGKPVRKCKLHAQNWRNRIYRIDFEDGGRGIAKQLVMGSDAMLRFQYAQLQELATLNITRLRVPAALGILPQKRVLVMEFAPGRSIEALAWTSSDVLRACDLAGKILAHIQLARTQSISPMPVELIAKDLAAAPWRLSPNEQDILRQTFDRLSRVSVPIGQVYYDYKPANLLFREDNLNLVDPPDTPWHGVHLWDFACFVSSLRRHIWRMNLRQPFNRRRRIVARQGINAFERSYRTTIRDLAPESFPVAVRLFELQRNAVLMTMQTAKVNLTREKKPIARGKRLGHPLANRLTLPLLEIEKRWLFKQLAHVLS